MKSILSVLIIILVTSCSSLKYSAVKNPDNYKNIKAGNKYTFLQTDGSKIPMVITSISKDSIIGTRKNERILIAKNNITEIRKDNSPLESEPQCSRPKCTKSLRIFNLSPDVMSQCLCSFISVNNQGCEASCISTESVIQRIKSCHYRHGYS